MNVEEVLKNLLYRYDCVIVPEFGGFVGKHKSAKFNPMDYTFEPPKKVIGFNSELKETDGLLANELSKLYNITYAESKQEIENLVNDWNNTLNTEKVVLIPALGSFQKVGNSLEFTPAQGQNFSYNTYGLNNVQGNYILKKEVQEDKKQAGSYWMFYVASVAFAFLVGTSVFTNNELVQPQLSSVFPFLNSDRVEVVTPESKVLNPINEEEIQEIVEEELPLEEIAVESNVEETPTETVEEPIVENPIVEEPVTTEQEIVEEVTIVEEQQEEVVTELNDLDVKSYQVIGGSFKVYSKAMQHQAMLKRKGYERAIIIGKVGNFYMVAFDTFHQEEDALAYKRELEKKGIDVFVR